MTGIGLMTQGLRAPALLSFFYSLPASNSDLALADCLSQSQTTPAGFNASDPCTSTCVESLSSDLLESFAVSLESLVYDKTTSIHKMHERHARNYSAGGARRKRKRNKARNRCEQKKLELS